MTSSMVMNNVFFVNTDTVDVMALFLTPKKKRLNLPVNDAEGITSSLFHVKKALAYSNLSSNLMSLGI